MQVNNAYIYSSPQFRKPGKISFVALNRIREFNSQLTAVQELDVSGRLRAEFARTRAARDAAADPPKFIVQAGMIELAPNL